MEIVSGVRVYEIVSTISRRESGFVSKKRDFVVLHTAEVSFFGS